MQPCSSCHQHLRSVPRICGQSIFPRASLTMELQGSERSDASVLGPVGGLLVFLPSQYLSQEPHRARGLHLAVQQMNSAGLAEQAGFDYKSPRILWGVLTRIPVLWEQKLPWQRLQCLFCFPSCWKSFTMNDDDSRCCLFSVLVC